MSSSVPYGVYGSMACLWDTTLLPLLEAAGAMHVLEIGCDAGHLTELLTRFCTERGGQAYAIDPSPRFGETLQTARRDGTLVFRMTHSIQALAGMPALDAVLIDGDHNYYTVLRELTMLEERTAHGLPFPLVLLHDTGWPYARRDQYCNPADIPDAHRRPYRTGGLVPGFDGIMTTGLNRDCMHALQEGGDGNGVLTAVEQFLRTTTVDVSCMTLPGIHGLGIITPVTLLHARPALGELLSALVPSPALQRHLEAVESDRIRTALVTQDRHDVIRTLQERTRTLQERTQALQLQLEQTMQRHAAEITHMHATRSWKLTAPLRALEAWLRGARQS